MAKTSLNTPPGRIADLVGLKEKGSMVTCQTNFDILPVDFAHRDNPFQAFIFLCRYKGAIDGEEYEFRNCYARGCPHNLCPHVSQAVVIANRYLQKDYHLLEEAGIDMERQLFTLEDMTVKFDGYQKEYDATLVIHDYINIAKEGNDVSVEVDLEYVPGVEHVVGYDNEMIFMMVGFTIDCLGKISRYERCLACFQMEREKEEKEYRINIANERLKTLYNEFDQTSIIYEKRFF
ncbi:MAG: hypothetical protein QNK29_13765 [Desulfobacterales bacterium]|nr:hypothetical protein [Desulfobacterales bacterium]MDX2513046.1 hypothetical protein [Desulfobacterales bacterium]